MQKTFPIFSYLEDFPFHFDEPYPSGISVYEEEDYIVIEAALPGIGAQDIEVSQSHGCVFLLKERKEKMTKSVNTIGNLFALFPIAFQFLQRPIWI